MPIELAICILRIYLLSSFCGLPYLGVCLSLVIGAVVTCGYISSFFLQFVLFGCFFFSVLFFGEGSMIN